MRTLLHRLAAGIVAFLSIVLPVAAQGLSPSFALSGLPASAVPGYPLSVTAGISGAAGPASGTVAMNLRNQGTGGVSAICGATTLAAGNATCSFNAPNNGSYEVEISYSGDLNYIPGATTWQFVVQQAAPLITLSGLPGNTVPGRTLLVQAHVSSASPMGNPTGSAAFLLRNLGTGGASSLCGATTLDGNGDALCGFVTPGNGSYQVEVQYSGDTSNAALTQTFPFSTQQAVVSFSLSGFPSSTVPGATLPLVVHVSSASPVGYPTGTAAFRLLNNSTGGSVYVCGATTLDANSDAACTFIAPPNGNYQLYIEYSGDASNAPLSVGYAFTTQQATPTIYLSGLASSVLPGATVAVVTHITSPVGFPTGTAAFLLRDFSTGGSVYVCGATTLDPNGDAACSFIAPAIGSYRLDIEYSGDSPNSPATTGFPFASAIPTISAVRPNSGAVAGGTAVEIEGTGLDTISVVTLGGANASIYRQSATSLTVTAPPHGAGSADVYIRNSDATAAVTVTSGFSFVDNDDAARDFSLANPSPRWTYGSEPSRGGTFSSYNVASRGGGLDSWSFGGLPLVHHNFTGSVVQSATNYTPPGGLAMHPGASGENSVVRWTAPESGTYHVAGSFVGNDIEYPTTTDVAVLHNNNASAPLFAGNIASYNIPNGFAFDVAVAAGDTIEFTVGYGGNGYFGDATGLDAVITLVTAGPPATAPGAPVMGGATAGNGQATISFSPPASDGGAYIYSYTAVSNPGGITASSYGSPIVVTGLTNGTTYTFTVSATNSAGTGPQSGSSNAVTPVAPPPLPITYTFSGTVSGMLGTTPFTNAAITVSAVGDANSVTNNSGVYCNILSSVTFSIAGAGSGAVTDPLAIFANNSNAAVGLWRGCGTSDWIGMYSAPALSSYTLATPISAVASSQYVQGDVNTTAGVLHFDVDGITQFNAGGGGAITTAPGAPVIGAASLNAKNPAQVDVTFTPPASNGGSTITGYTATASPGGMTASGTRSPITLTGLSPCLVYTVTVTATNAVGTSLPSAASNAISPSAPANASPFLTPSSLTFASRTVSTTSPAQTVTIANGGACTIAIASMAITGDFAFATACPATLAAGATCTVDVTFTPLVAGSRNGTLTILDDAAGSPHTLSLTGTGLSTAAPVAEISPPLMDFAAQPVGHTSATELLTVTNSGNAPLTFSSIGISGEFALVAPASGATTALQCPVTLGPGASCEIRVTFHPTGPNLREGLLTMVTNAGTITVRLVGTGLIPAPPQLALVSSLAFGSQPIGTRSAGLPLVIRNTSEILATITELSATGDFNVSDTCATIVGGTTCSPLVTFEPTDLGPRTGTLTVRTLRDADAYTVSLTGTGEENRLPVLQLSATSIGFGNAFLGQPVTREVTIRNAGTAPLIISSILAGGGFFSETVCITTLAAGSSCTMHVTFLPGIPGSQAASLEIVSNAAGSPHQVSVSGTGCFLPTPSRARLGGLLCGP